METSLFLAKLLGIVFAVIGLGLLINFKSYQKIFQDFVKNSALLYIGGLISLIIGVLLVLSHNIWEGGWVVLITVLGWMSLVKGIILLLFPKWMVKMGVNMCTTGYCTFAGIFALLVGLYLMNAGFAWGLM